MFFPTGIHVAGLPDREVQAIEEAKTCAATLEELMQAMTWSRPPPLIDADPSVTSDKPVTFSEKFYEDCSHARGLHAELLNKAPERFLVSEKARMASIADAFAEVITTLQSGACSRYSVMLKMFFCEVVNDRFANQPSVSQQLVDALKNPLSLERVMPAKAGQQRSAFKTPLPTPNGNSNGNAQKPKPKPTAIANLLKQCQRMSQASGCIDSHD